jgi:hypothetical protein
MEEANIEKSEASAPAREKKEAAMPTTTITRKVNQKLIKKIRVGKNIYPVEEFNHSQDGVEVTYRMKNGKTKTEVVERGSFSSRLITGYPTKKDQDS